MTQLELQSDQPKTEREKMNAKEIILAVMHDVQGLKKGQRNTQGSGYNFRGIDDVMNAVGPALRKHGGFIVPFVNSIDASTVPSKNGGALNTVRLTVTFEVHGTDGEPISGTVAAEAFDSGDKATAKAMSVAFRTFLLQLLCLPTDEPDPDSFTYEVAARDWSSDIAALTSKKQARALFMTAKQNKATDDVMAAITAKAETLVEE